MKKLFLTTATLFIFWALPTLAIPEALPVFEGSYQFNEASLQVAQAKHTVRLIVMNEESKQLLQNYREQAYACVAEPNSHYICQKFVNDWPLAASVEAEILKEMKGSIIHFEKTESLPEQINDSQMLKEWTLEQLCTFQNIKYNKVHYYQLDSLLKLALVAESGDKTYFHIENGKISAQLMRTTSLAKTSPYEIQNFVMFNVSVHWLSN